MLKRGDKVRATRNLKILGIIGGILSLAAIVLSIYSMVTTIDEVSNENWTSSRNCLLKRMPPSELRADFAILTSRNEFLDPEAYATRDITLEQASQKYPNSARVQLRVGLFSKNETAIKALHKAAALDTQNALPLYLLASKAAARGAWDESFDLLKQGNMREYSTGYPIYAKDLPIRGMKEAVNMIDIDIIDGGNSYCANLRQLARTLSRHATELQPSGQIVAALRTTDEVKKMSRAVMSGAPGDEKNTMSVLTGVAMTGIALNAEKQIYRSNKNRAGLAKVEHESRETCYLKVGVNLYFGKMMEYTLVRMRRLFTAPVAVGSIFVQILFTFIYLIVWGVLALKSRNIPANELHFKATELAFPTGRLLLYYFLFFVPAGIATSVIGYRSSFSSFLFEMPASILVISVLPVALGIWAHCMYGRAYRREAQKDGNETPKFRWKRAPVQEKREYIARMSGVHGGALIFLTICALGILVWVKSSQGVYPWQIDSIFSDSRKEESRYIGELLAHKIKVPESAIRAEQKKLEKYAKKSGK